MAGQIEANDRVPEYWLEVTTYELSTEKGLPVWIATLTHVFFGDTEEEAHKVMQAHTKTDQFFAGSLVGKWNKIILRNSDPRLYRKSP